MPKVELDPDLLAETAARLQARIEARFPGSALGQRAGDLIELLASVSIRADDIARPIWPLRLLAGALLVAVVGLLAVLPWGLSGAGLDNALQRIQFVESAVNDAVFLGAGLLFVWTLESRIKRRRALRVLHELRSFAHVIDMLQLTKDPQRVPANRNRATPMSPPTAMDAYELGRYLDYCSELLSLAAKGAAIMALRFDDPVVLGAVNEIEDLTNGLSRKIWQKLMIILTTDAGFDHDPEVPGSVELGLGGDGVAAGGAA